MIHIFFVSRYNKFLARYLNKICREFLKWHFLLTKSVHDVFAIICKFQISLRSSKLYKHFKKVRGLFNYEQKKNVMFSLKFYIICLIVVIIYLTSLTECIVFFSLWKLSVELELKCKLPCLLLLHLAVLLNFVWTYGKRPLSLSIMSMAFIDID